MYALVKQGVTVYPTSQLGVSPMNNVQAISFDFALPFDYFIGTGTSVTNEGENVVFVLNRFESFAIQQDEDGVVVYHFITDLDLRQCIEGSRKASEVHLFAPSFEMYTNSFNEVVGAYITSTWNQLSEVC